MLYVPRMELQADPKPTLRDARTKYICFPHWTHTCTGGYSTSKDSGRMRCDAVGFRSSEIPVNYDEPEMFLWTSAEKTARWSKNRLHSRKLRRPQRRYKVSYWK